MFKNAIIYRIVSMPDAQAIAGLEFPAFAPCAASQESSSGFVPPRGPDNGPLAESVAGQIIMKLMIETKAVPSDIIDQEYAAKAKEIEEQTGRKPGKKESREIKQDLMLALLPMAFPKRSATLIWIDPAAKLLVLDTSSQTRADEIVSLLVKSLPDFALELLSTQSSPAASMAMWLATQDAPQGFSVDRECELKACDESKAVVKYGNHSLDITEVQEHIKAGKVPTKLALTWNDRVSFVLTDAMTLKKITFLDVVFTERSQDTEADSFYADMAISTGELRKLLPALFDALGGEFSTTEAPEDKPAAHTGDGEDPLYAKALQIVQTNDKASISLVQRHLKIGYNRAARLIELMEANGIVSPMAPSGTRTLIKK